MAETVNQTNASVKPHLAAPTARAGVPRRRIKPLTIATASVVALIFAIGILLMVSGKQDLGRGDRQWNSAFSKRQDDVRASYLPASFTIQAVGVTPTETRLIGHFPNQPAAAVTLGINCIGQQTFTSGANVNLYRSEVYPDAPVTGVRSDACEQLDGQVPAGSASQRIADDGYEVSAALKFAGGVGTETLSLFIAGGMIKRWRRRRRLA